MSPVDGRTILGRHVVGINDVLDPERHAMQRATGLAPVQGACLGHDLILIEILPGLHRGFTHRNMFETGARHRFTGGVPVAYGLDDVCRRQGVQRLRAIQTCSSRAPSCRCLSPMPWGHDATDRR